MSDEMKDAGILLQWFGAPCHCRCSHCCLRSGRAVSTVSFYTARRIAERFVRWRDGQGDRDFLVDFTAGYSCEFPELPEYIAFRSEVNPSASNSLQINGIRIRALKELRPFLETLKSVGVRRIGMTFFGTRARHDKFAHRKGDFDFLLDIAKTVTELGMGRFETIFLHRGSIPEISLLLTELDSIPGLDARYIEPWDYRGRAKALEDARPTRSDIDRLPQDVRRYVNLEKYRSEAEWLEDIASGNIPAKKHRYLFTSIWEENVRYLLSADCERIVSDLREMNDKFLSTVPSLEVLAVSFGRHDEDRIYALRDLEWKWQDMYLHQHPELGATEALNELGGGAFLK